MWDAASGLGMASGQLGAGVPAAPERGRAFGAGRVWVWSQ
eukprot:CAMPEP_0119355628 /NCGR_PEP_ID=MMETSP1334-20130426/4436_1 /TAXON_ID=127549 /ORGANISM="Calcidiscus leptoporus, Strain RCC1130" /LENGTH=39 /DNA_ID= /DNA_START= /DNA_END= /DNA_ORIENTATION=